MYSDNQSQLLYELSLTTSGVNAATEGSLQSFVGFDFNGDGSDALLGSDIISGFGASEVNIGEADRSLLGDFTFAAGQGTASVDSDNTNVDVFQGPVSTSLGARFNGVFDGGPGTGDLAFGAFSNFDARSADQTDVTAGVVAFQSAAPSVIPEPSAFMLAASSLGTVAFRRRRRNA